MTEESGELVVLCQCGHVEPIMRTVLTGEQVRCRACRKEFELGCNNVARRLPPPKQRELDLK